MSKYEKEPYVHYKNAINKQVTNGKGFVLMTYPDVPMNLKFKHKAVNDYNQHLCNGWHVVPHKNQFEEVDRVVNGLKPLGISHPRDFDEMIGRAIEYFSKGYLVSYKKNKVIKGMYNFTVSQPGLLGDYFDMDTLAKDYENNGLYPRNIHKYKNISFAEFHNDRYDKEYHPIEIVGLVLGYPIENTISLIKRDMDDDCCYSSDDDCID